MKNKEDINSLLALNGFKLVEKKVSPHFGDYYDTFSNNIIELRFSSSKSFISVDIRNIEGEKIWFDLALVRALLYQEQKLNVVTTIDEHFDFLEKEFNLISELFKKENYDFTKKKLKDLEDKRAKQMFPGIIK